MGVDSTSLNVPGDPIYVFDTSVLRSFAVAGRLGLLEDRYAVRARMTVEVRAEIASSVAYEPTLEVVLSAQWLLPPVASNAVDDIERIRWLLGGKSHDRRHLGEAGSIQVAIENGWILAIDDWDASRYARGAGVGTINTLTILRALVREGVVSPAEGIDLRDTMFAHGRRLPPAPESFFTEEDS